MKNCTPTNGTWFQMGATLTVAVAACTVSTPTSATPVTHINCLRINWQIKCIKPISPNTTPAAEHIEHVRKNPRRKAAMDRAAAKIADKIALKAGGETFVSLRMKKGFTQSELAAAAGLRQPYLSRIENSKQSLHNETVQKLANALGVSPLEVRAAFERQYEYMEQA